MHFLQKQSHYFSNDPRIYIYIYCKVNTFGVGIHLGVLGELAKVPKYIPPQMFSQKYTCKIFIKKINF